jgi:1-acyl-sn-glycerol-3-phosphate acyltransferase
MKYILSIYCWVIGMTYFFTICFIGILLTFILPQEKLDPWIKNRLKLLFKLLQCKVEVHGIEKIDPRGTYLFMANHTSLFDVPLLGAYIPTFVRGVEAKQHFSWPIYGWMLRRLGNIPIDRKNIHASIRSIRQTETLLQKGKSIIIMPEGHRTLNGQLLPFKKLPFFLSKQADIPIIPMGLSGLFHLKSKRSWLIRPTTLKVKFGDVIPVEKIRALSTIELMDITRNEIKNLVEFA